MGGHAASAYPVRIGGKLALMLRGREPVFLADPKELRALFRDRDVHAYDWVFGRRAPSELPSKDALIALGEAMMTPVEGPVNPSPIPAGYTYLGQFIFHDITYMKRERKCGSPDNLRTPALDLDSVLDAEDSAWTEDRLLRIGCTTGTAINWPEDLPRAGVDQPDWGRPKLGDDRNDDFLPLAQCHLLLLKFFNAVGRWFGVGCKVRDTTYSDTRQRLLIRVWRRHFQWIVLNDYLPLIIDGEVYRDVRERGRRIVAPKGTDSKPDWLPLEFVVAAGRFGHSMIREDYGDWNAKQPSATLQDFMEFSYSNSDDGLERHLGGLPVDWMTNWSRLFRIPQPHMASATAPLSAAPIGTRLAGALGQLPGCILSVAPCRQVLQEYEKQGLPPSPTVNLACVTLKRGWEMGLASAQQALDCVDNLTGGRLQRLTPDQLRASNNPCVAKVLARLPELINATPLWYYVLKEAEVLHCGQHLGPLGSRIVMEALHAALEASEDSILADPSWKPTLPGERPGHFTMADLIAFSGNADPLGSYVRERATIRGGANG